jgi:hypothetical protein
MAIKLSLLSVNNPTPALIEARILVTLTGSYPGGAIGTAGGGEVLDWTTLYNQQASVQPGGEITSDMLPIEAYAESEAQDAYYYQIQMYTPGTPPVALATNKCSFHVLSAGGTEFSSGSSVYSGATNDCIRKDYIVIHAAFASQI